MTHASSEISRQHGKTANSQAVEAPINTYLRELHERAHGRDPHLEPVRGRDPWHGVGL